MALACSYNRKIFPWSNGSSWMLSCTRTVWDVALSLNLQWWWRLIFGALNVQILDGGFLVAFSESLSWLGVQSIGRFQASVADLSHGSGVTLIICCISSDSYLFAKKTSSPCHTQVVLWGFSMQERQSKWDSADCGTSLFVNKFSMYPLVLLQVGISLFFHPLLWPDILLISSLNSLYCPFCPLPVKFSLGFSLLFARSFPIPSLCYLLWGAQGAGDAAGFSAGTRSFVQGRSRLAQNLWRTQSWAISVISWNHYF